MSRTISLTDEIAIDVPVDVAYARVSDVTAMGQWSPENIGALILGPNQIPVVGMVFDGYNKRGRLKWRTRCKVTAAQPNVSFAFKVLAFGLGRLPLSKFPIPTTWSYSFRALDEQSTVVTETWTVGPWPGLLIRLITGTAADGINAVEMQRRNLRITMQNLKSRLEAEQKMASAESEPSSGASR
jgi:hypothetical protein